MEKPRAIIISVVTIVVAIVVVLTFFGTSASEIQKGADSIATNCTGVGVGWNESNNVCINSSGGYISEVGTELPITNLFARDGVAVLVLVAAILLTVIIFLLKGYKQK